MGYSVYRSDPAKTTAAGFGKVAHLPCIFDSRPGYLIALRIGPAKVRRRSTESLAASFIAEIAYTTAPVVFALALARWFDTDSWDDAGTKFLSQLRQEDLEPLSNGQRSRVLSECKRMQLLHDHGWWQDLPLLDLDEPHWVLWRLQLLR